MPHQPNQSSEPGRPVSSDKHRLQVQFPVDDFEALRTVARTHRRSIAGEVELAIREHLARQHTPDRGGEMDSAPGQAVEQGKGADASDEAPSASASGVSHTDE